MKCLLAKFHTKKKKYKANKFDAIHYMKLIHLQTKKKQNKQTNLIYKIISLMNKK